MNTEENKEIKSDQDIDNTVEGSAESLEPSEDSTSNEEKQQDAEASVIAEAEKDVVETSDVDDATVASVEEEEEMPKLESAQTLDAEHTLPEQAESKIPDSVSETISTEAVTVVEKVEEVSDEEAETHTSASDETAADPLVDAAETSDTADAPTEEDGEDHEDDEEGHERAEHDRAFQLPDLEELNPEALYALAKEMLQSEPIQTLKKSMDRIAQEFYSKLKQEHHDKYEAFVAEGGEPTAFEWEHPLRSEFSALMTLYRDEREKYQEDLNARLEANLKKRTELIDELKELINSEEQFSVTFDHFKKIQDEWRACGPVPRAKSSDIYRNYHHHLENFFDYLKLNREVREMHFQKNLEKKEELVRRAEALLAEKDIHVAGRKLQRLHKIWKEDTGPVSPEKREEIWEKFSAATRAFHERRHDWENAQKEKQLENLRKKEALCDKADALLGRDFKGHKDWQRGVEDMNGIFETFKKSGRVPDEFNDSIWERFLAIRKTFNHNKNEFYKSLKASYKENLDKRNALIAEAEALKDSDDWKETAEKLKKLQQQWKKVGHVPHKLNQETWKKFRAACNTFFDRRKEHWAKQDEQYEDNYKKKEALMAKLEGLELPEDHKEGVKAIKQVIAEWRSIGRVPRDKMTIDGAFNKLVDLKFDQLGLSGKGKGNARFSAKLDILSAGNDNRRIDKEKAHWRRKINDAMDELRQMEANIQLLAPTGNRENPLVQSVAKKIDKLKQEIDGYKDKLKMIREAVSSTEKEEKTEENTPLQEEKKEE
jgi:hypothetical protein